MYGLRENNFCSPVGSLVSLLRESYLLSGVTVAQKSSVICKQTGCPFSNRPCENNIMQPSLFPGLSCSKHLCTSTKFMLWMAWRFHSCRVWHKNRCSMRSGVAQAQCLPGELHLYWNYIIGHVLLNTCWMDCICWCIPQMSSVYLLVTTRGRGVRSWK